MVILDNHRGSECNGKWHEDCVGMKGQKEPERAAKIAATNPEQTPLFASNETC